MSRDPASAPDPGSEDQQTSSGRRPLGARLFIAVGGGIALLLLGAAAGLLIATPSAEHAHTEQQPSAVDIGFAQDMTVHHQQAVTMATLARERAADVAVRQLAFDIETNQRDQIGRMQGWLSLWGEPAQAAGAPMQWMQGGSGHGSGHGSGGHGSGPEASPGGGHGTADGSMPGMATSEELAHLRTLRGPEFDVRFLQLMLRHHEGGAPMARYGAEHAGLDAVRGLGANMLGSQSTESELMRRMLAERGAHPLPPR